MSCDFTLRMRDVIVVCIAFVGGFYLGYLNASSFCDPMIDPTVQTPIAVIATAPDTPSEPLVKQSPSTDIGLIPNGSTSSNVIKSNHFDTTYQWQYFKNHNTELSPYFVPEKRIIFCGIPKNAISMWKMVLLRLLGFKWWLTRQAEIHAFENGLAEYRLWSLNFSAVDSMMNDPNWYKVVFIRDPLERVLSGVLDKGYTLKTNWDKFEDYLLSKGRDQGHHLIDQHLRPQHKFCDLYKYRDQYRVLSFHNKEHRKLFFDENGLWDEYGASNWSVSDHDSRQQNDGQMHDIRSFGVVEKRHHRNAADKLLGKYTMRRAAFVLRYYQYDYLLFNLTVPSWICQLVARESGDIQQFLPVQHLKANVQGFKRSTKLDALKGAIIKYEDLLELYLALKIFPEVQRPPCMDVIRQCVELGQCSDLEKAKVEE